MIHKSVLAGALAVALLCTPMQVQAAQTTDGTQTQEQENGAATDAQQTEQQDAAAEGLSIGSKVYFYARGGVLSGIVTYVGKTATVMVEDRRGAYRDQTGKRYAKYRVPLEHLTIKSI